MKVTRIMHASVNVHGHLEETGRCTGSSSA